MSLPRAGHEVFIGPQIVDSTLEYCFLANEHDGLCPPPFQLSNLRLTGMRIQVKCYIHPCTVIKLEARKYLDRVHSYS